MQYKVPVLMSESIIHKLGLCLLLVVHTTVCKLRFV